MGVSKIELPEEEMKKWLNHIALICLSEDFQNLKKELEKIYSQADTDEDAQIAAFQDALYAFLAQEEDELTCQTGTN